MRWWSIGLYQTLFLESADKHGERDWFLREVKGDTFGQTAGVGVMDDIHDSRLGFRYRRSAENQAVNTQFVD